MWTRFEKAMLLLIIMGGNAPGNNELTLAATGILGLMFFIYQLYYNFKEE